VGLVNYQSARVPTGLYAEYVFPPKVGVRRDRFGNDVEVYGVDVEPVSVSLTDGRSLGLTLDRHGVELLPSPFVHHDYYDIDEVLSKYYHECAQLVRQATGARRVIAFDHNIRSVQKRGNSMGGNFAVQPPLELVHGDYTEASARKRVQQLAAPPTKNDTLRRVFGDKPPLDECPEEALGRRFCIVNVWRSIHAAPIEQKPLGVLSPGSVPLEDIVVHEIHYDDRIGENYNARHGPGHTWWFFPGMGRDEALLLKCWDSAGRLARQPPPGERVDATFAFHSALDVAARPEASDRESIEVRTLALF